MAESVKVSVNQSKFNDWSKDFVSDLIAYFNLLNEDIVKLIDKASKEGWTPEQIIDAIEELI